MAKTAGRTSLRPIPITPSEEVWRAMSPDERQRFVLEAVEILAEHRQVRRINQMKGLAGYALYSMRGVALEIAKRRGIPCSDAARKRLKACNDPKVLSRWVPRVMTAGSLDEAIADGGSPA